jgi:N-acetylglucosamine-6-sulfatase
MRPVLTGAVSIRAAVAPAPTPIEDRRQRILIEAVAERGAVPHPPFVDESEVVPLLTGDPLPASA